MIDTTKKLERLLQKFRFRKIKNYLKGDVLDFGGNKGELKSLINGKYWVINYDHSLLDELSVDTIVCTAVIEHLEVKDVYKVFKKFNKILKKDGLILLTTPTPKAHSVLSFLAFLGLLDKNNILEHKHYWTKKELFNLAKESDFIVKKYKKFQFGFNQFVIFTHKK